jgi:hypothetical protein
MSEARVGIPANGLWAHLGSNQGPLACEAAAGLAISRLCPRSCGFRLRSRLQSCGRFRAPVDIALTQFGHQRSFGGGHCRPPAFSPAWPGDSMRRRGSHQPCHGDTKCETCFCFRRHGRGRPCGDLEWVASCERCQERERGKRAEVDRLRQMWAARTCAASGCEVVSTPGRAGPGRGQALLRPLPEAGLGGWRGGQSARSTMSSPECCVFVGFAR